VAGEAALVVVLVAEQFAEALEGLAADGDDLARPD
jgi:hypothetical protein